jgi:H+-translocating NAD(P) transhydrogenase subunit alpha
MQLAIITERRPNEKRVAATPDTVKKLLAMGFKVVIETGAGQGAAITDSAFAQAGATIVATAALALEGADVVLKVQRPLTAAEGGIDELCLLKSGAVLVGMLDPHRHREDVALYAAAGINAIAMELMPRITRAQSMDVLSSQSNLAGYKAVLDGAGEFGRAFPMMMTAAGTVPPARVCVLGAGVAGLQAIATARRLGAIVSAFDVRAAVKEQVMSLGASFIEVEGEDLSTAGGYAREASEDYKRRQAEKIHETLKKQDIVICTALIPGREAPELVTPAMVADMRPGAVLVDLAVESGGNCRLSKPGQIVVTENGVKLVGHYNVPSRIAVDASALYAKNLINFLPLLLEKDSQALKFDLQDEIIKAVLLTREGGIIHPAFATSAAA